MFIITIPIKIFIAFSRRVPAHEHAGLVAVLDERLEVGELGGVDEGRAVVGVEGTSLRALRACTRFGA